MTAEQHNPSYYSSSQSSIGKDEPAMESSDNDTFSSKEIFDVNNGKNLPTGQLNNDVATDTGTTIDTLDTALHNALDISKGHAISGSNRADFYESKSYGKSDAEEEMEVIKRRARK